MPTLGDLITAIQNSLNAGVSSRYCAVGSVQPGTPPFVNQAESLSSASLSDVQSAVTYAVQSKWKIETTGGNLRIKGAEMVKSITGLDPE